MRRTCYRNRFRLAHTVGSLAACTIVLLATAHAVPIMNPAAISVRQLDNGLRVIVKEAHSSPVVTIDLYVRSGSAVDTPLTSGAMHLLEHMIFQHEPTRYGGRVAVEIEALGGELYAETTRDFMHFRATVAAEHFAHALDELGLAVSKLDISNVRLSQEQRIVLLEMEEYAEHPVRAITEAGFSELYGAHPYALPTAGSPARIMRIDRNDLLALHQAHFTGPNMAVVVVGDVKPQAVFEAAGKALGGLPNMRAPTADPPAVAPPADERRKEMAAPGPTSFLLFGFLGPGIAEKDAVCATDVLLGIVGEGSSSLLQTEIAAKRQNVRAVGAGFLTQRYPGMFYVWLEVTDQAVDDVTNDVRGLLRRLAEQGVSEEHVQRGRNIILGAYAMQCETFPDQAGALGFYEAIDTYEFAVEYEQRIRSVTKAQVDSIARRLFTQKPVIVVLKARPTQGA